MNTIKTYLLSVIASALLGSFLSNLLPQGKCKQILCFAGTLVMILTVISPLMKLDSTKMARSIASLRIQTEQWRTGVEVQTRELQGKIIKEESEAYVLDKAEAMGVSISPEITLREDGAFPYPYEIVMEGTWSEEDRRVLSTLIAEDLGIPIQRQEWRRS